MDKKIKYNKKAIVGQRQLLRRAREAKLSLISDLQASQSSACASPHLITVPSTSSHNCVPQALLQNCSDNYTPDEYNTQDEYNYHYNFEDHLGARQVLGISSIEDLNVDQLISDTDSDDSDKTTYLKTNLANWATVQHQVPHNYLNSLLKILSPLFPDLPKDSRTLLNTPMNFRVTDLNTGHFVYLGLFTQLQKQIDLFKAYNEDREIKVSFNIDGLPLFKSSNTQLWPILGLIKNYPSSRPFVVALFCGQGKPSPLDVFMKEFVDELAQLLEFGLEFDNIHYTVKVHSFICDAPARALIKCTKQHGGYSACDKCVEPGEYKGRVIYESVSATRRTDESFRLKLDEDHHVGESPLLRLPIDMITLFPTEYMHNVCLGVMRKLLNVWISGDLNVRLQSRTVKLISEKLISCSKFIPVEFNRKPRSLSELARWKATEFRTFLLYVGPIVLKDVLPRSLYENFILFHSAITVLCSSKHIRDIGIDFAREVLMMFINHSKSVYGLHFLVYNVHMLCHISDDAHVFGTLDEYSAFPFENHLKTLKKLVRSPNRPLQQIVKRLKEIQTPKKESPLLELSLFEQHFTGPVPEENIYQCYKKVTYKKYVMYVSASREADCYCLTKNKKVFKIYNILKKDTLFLYGKEFLRYEPFFEYPFNSVAIDVTVVKELSNFKLISLNDIVSKCVIIYTDNNTVCVPMLHHYECDR